MRKSLSRRNFLKLGLGGLVFGGCQSIPFENQIVKRGENLVAPRNFNLEEAVEANKLLINFPDTIKGAESVKKYLIPKAKYCLVHIRQGHLIENTPETEFKKIKEVQGNIYSILSEIIRDYGITKVYDEGLTESFAPIKNLCAGVNYLSTCKTNHRKESIEKLVPSSITSLDTLKKESPKIYETYLLFEKDIGYDAVYKIASETGNLEIIGADDAEALDKANYMYKKLKRAGFFGWFIDRENIFNAIREDRENIFLNIASKQEEPLVVVVYGARHAWGGEESCGKDYSRKEDSICDNISKWNSNNPDKKFSLIEISPFGL